MTYRFEHYGVNEGLSQGNVTTVMRDKMGLMWFGTWDGVTVFDGFKNQIYRERSKDSTTLKGALVNSIFETKQGQIIVATSHCLNFFNAERHNFRHYNIDHKPNDFRIVEAQNSNLLVSINNELWWFNCETKQFSKNRSELSELWNLYFSTTTKAVNHAEGLYSHIYQYLNLKKLNLKTSLAFFEKHTINDIFIHHDTSYFATDDGVYRLNLRTQKIESVLPEVKAKCLVNFNTKLYIGTQSNGVIIYDIQSHQIEGVLNYDERNKYSLSGNFVRTMYIDREQIIWVSSLGNGINYCNLSKPIVNTILTKYDPNLLTKQDHYIKNMVEDKDSVLWVVSVTGNIYLFNQSYKLIKTITPSQVNAIYKPNSYQQCFLSPLNHLFFLSENGMYRYIKNNRFERIDGAQLNQSQLYLSSMSMDIDNSAIIATRQGLLRMENSTNPSLKTDSSLNYSNVILSTYTDKKGHLFINPMFAGIDIYSIQSRGNKRIKTIHLGCNAKHYVEENDTLWIATTKGIIKLDLNTLEYDVFDEADGLPNQYIYCLLRDKNLQNTFWMSSNKGIFRYNTVTKDLFTLGLRDGLASLEFNTNSFVKRKNGDLVFGSIDGFSYFNPDSLLVLNQENHLVTFDFKLNNSYVDRTDFKVEDTIYKIPYNLNTISFRLMQLHFPTSDIPIYYFLEGYDNQWAIVSNPVDVRYSNLKEGNYKFKTRFFDRNKGWILQTHYSLIIQAPWYRSWYAYFVYILLLLVVVFVVVQQHFKRKLNKELEVIRKQKLIMDERSRISADLHDDIGATLSSMYLYSDMANTMIYTKPDQSKAMLEKIVYQSKELMQRMGDIIWSMKSSEDDKYTIKARLLQYSLDLLSPKDIQLHIDIDPTIDRNLKNPNLRKNMLLIIKEAFNNIAKYSKASNVTLKLGIRNHKIFLTVFDDGIGFDTANHSQGNGLKNIEFRTKQLDGRFEIYSNPENGTRLECFFPI